MVQRAREDQVDQKAVPEVAMMAAAQAAELAVRVAQLRGLLPQKEVRTLLM